MCIAQLSIHSSPQPPYHDAKLSIHIPFCYDEQQIHSGKKQRLLYSPWSWPYMSDLWIFLRASITTYVHTYTSLQDTNFLCLPSITIISINNFNKYLAPQSLSKIVKQHELDGRKECWVKEIIDLRHLYLIALYTVYDCLLQKWALLRLNLYVSMNISAQECNKILYLAIYVKV